MKTSHRTITAFRLLILTTSLTLLQGCYVGFGVGTATSTLRSEAKIEHVVLVWLKEPGNKDHIAELMAASAELRKIPGVLAVRAGEPIASERPVVDDSFDVGVVIEFDSVEALRSYDQHPIHTKAVREVLGPRAGRFIVYDIGVE